jgi:hypothetical protein
MSKRDRRASRMKAGADPADEAPELRVGGFIPPDKIRTKLGIGEIQKCLEALLIVRTERFVTGVEECLQQDIQLAHAATATPSKTGSYLRIPH